MNTNVNSTAYIGNVSQKNGEDEAEVIYDCVLQPEISDDPIRLRKLACEMISHCIENINPSEELTLTVDILCIDTETEIVYPVFGITGNCDLIELALENEINLLTGVEQMRVDVPTLLIEKDSMHESNWMTPNRSVRMQAVGFEYPNKN